MESDTFLGGYCLGVRISTNVASMGVGRQLHSVQESRSRTLEKLSSGERIVRAGDDAAGLSISEKLKAGIRSLQVAGRNSNDGISIMQTAEGGMQDVQNILVRLRELAVQGASDTIGDVERGYTDQEFQRLKGEIHRIAHTTKFNGTDLLNGMGGSLEFQVGIGASKRDDRVHFSAGDTNVTPSALGISGAHLSTKESSRNNLSLIDKAMNKIGMFRSYLGGMQSALSSNVQNVDNQRTNLAHANSRIRDADMAELTAKSVQEEITVNAGGAVLLQANKMVGDQALKLLGS